MRRTSVAADVYKGRRPKASPVKVTKFVSGRGIERKAMRDHIEQALAANRRRIPVAKDSPAMIRIRHDAKWMLIVREGQSNRRA